MKKLISFFVLSLIFLIVGCSKKTYTLSQTKKTTTKEEFTTTTDNRVPDHSSTYNYYELSKKGYLDWYYLNSIGEQKILVIPVDYESGKSGYVNAIDDINEAFFSDGEEMNFESVRSFYNKSSYGLLDITGTVTGWTRSFSFSELRKSEQPILDYTSEFLLDESIDPRDYDLDGDGYLDLVVYLYSAPISENDRNVPSYFWAFTYSNDESIPDPDFPTVNNYCFISMDFLYDENGDLDAHTFIHEMGHALGLDDYYDDEALAPCPVGKSTMMSHNVQDLDMFSKIALGWVNDPLYFVRGISDYVLEPYQDSPSCLIIGNNFNGDAFSEYILLEYYTPTGLNERDALYPFEGVMCPLEKGIRVYHVDARLCVEGDESYKILKNTSYYDEDDGILSIPMLSNTRDFSIIKNSFYDELDRLSYLKLIELIDKSGVSHLEEDYYQNNDSLYKTGDSLDLSLIKFHDGSNFDYTISFNELENGNYSINFVKNK